MPIYEYRCSDCHQIFEEWLKTFDDSPRNCPVCNGVAERVVSNTSFVLKGGGWYVTEYGNRKPEKPESHNTSKPETPASPSSTEAASGASSQAASTPAPAPAASASAAQPA